MFIRDFISGEQANLRQVFMSSVHELACGFYTKEQLDAWASPTYDEQQWADRITALRPFIAIVDDRVAGYADLQRSGYIDHFFVSGQFFGCGIGSALMSHIHQVATMRGISELSAHVSLAAESFFSKRGFPVVQRQSVTVNGVFMNNALMTKQLLANNSFKPTPLRGAA
jgi:putative acetyltransferase